MHDNASTQPAPRETPDTPDTPGAPAKPRRRWARRFILLLGCVMVLLGVASYLTRPARLNRVLVDMLEESIGCEATVGRAHLTWDGLLTIDGIDLIVPDATGEMAQLMHTDRVAVQLHLWPLATGRVRAAWVALSQPTLYLTEDIDQQRFNYEMLLARPPSGSDEGGLPDALPELRLNGGEIRFGQINDGVYRAVESMQFDGTLRADPDRYGGYHFELIQRMASSDSADPAGPSIHGEIDLREPMIEFEMDRFSFNGPYRYLLPQAMRHWWDRLSPRGALPRVVFSARRDEQQVNLSAEMELDGIGLSVPLAGKRSLELTDVTGEVTMESGAITFENLTGDIEGIGFSADGRSDGLVLGSPFKISLKTEPFVVPAEGGIWESLPEVVSKYRGRFSPHGKYQTQVEFERSEIGAGLKLRGHLDLLETQFKYAKFPYPVEQLTGRITFSDDRIILNDLIGVAPSGAHAVVSGGIGPPLDGGAIEIVVRSEAVPIDEHLMSAMKPKHRKILDMFFNQAGYESLLADGVIRAPGTVVAAANDAVTLEDDVPVFEPGGAAAMAVYIRRPAGKDQKYRVTTDLQGAGLNSVFEFWPYPLIVESGHVVISPDDVTVYDLRLRALTGGGGMVQGRLELPTGGRTLQPSLQLTSIRLPIDALLIASLSKSKAKWVRWIQLNGELVGTGEVTANSEGKILFTIDTQLHDGSALPNGGAYALDDIRGSVTIERTRVQLEDVTGRHGNSTITINGLADVGDSGVGVDLTFLGDQLPIERGLIDLIPPGHKARPVLENLFNTYEPDGMVDARLTYLGGRDEPDEFKMDVEPESLNFDYKGQRIELMDLAGHAELTPDKATLHGFKGHYAAGSFTIDGDLRYGGDNGLALTFDVDADRLDATARALLPEGALSLVDQMSIQGPFVLDDARLLTWPEAEQGPTGIFESKIQLRGATADFGVPLTEMDADLDVHIVTFADQRWPHTDVHLKADRLRALDRLVRRLSFHAETAGRPSLINLNNIKGTVYGGTLIGHGQLQLGEKSSLGLDLTIQEVELDPFLLPFGERASAHLDQADPDVLPTRDMSSGLLSAGLSLRVPLVEEGRLQGRGIVTVRDAQLYDRPITLALLQAANLALPSESSFDRASARYLIVGETVLFDDIRFEAPAFVISGTGSMAYPSTELNLRMVTHNPEALNLGPVSDLVRTFKDELLGIEVRGTLAEPQAAVVPLEGVFRSWGRIFGSTRAQVSEVQTKEPQPNK